MVEMKVRFFYTVTAVVFGADETLLDIELVNDFKFVKRGLMPLVDHLDTVFETDAMGLRRDYEASVVDKEHLGVICVEKKLSFEIDGLQMAKFHAEWSKKFYDVIVPYLV